MRLNSVLQTGTEPGMDLWPGAIPIGILILTPLM